MVVDSRKKRDGQVLENIGTYDGLKTSFVSFKPERYDAWKKLGAQPSDTVKKLYHLHKKQQAGAAPSVPEAAKKEVPKKEQKKSEPAKTAETPSESPKAVQE